MSEFYISNPMPDMPELPNPLKQAAQRMARCIGHGGSGTLRKVADMIDTGRAIELSYVSAECLRMLATDFDDWEKTARGLGNVLSEDRAAFDAELKNLRTQVERVQREASMSRRSYGAEPEAVTFIFLDAQDADPDAVGVELAMELALILQQDGARVW